MKSYYAKKWFMHTAMSYLSTPYLWGGDDPLGFDCSGYVVECLKSAGLMKLNEDLSSQGLFEKFSDKIISKPKKGTLLFVFKYNRAAHVAVCLDKYYQISALGGGSQTDSVEASFEQNAFIKIRPISIFKSEIRFVYPF